MSHISTDPEMTFICASASCQCFCHQRAWLRVLWLMMKLPTQWKDPVFNCINFFIGFTEQRNVGKNAYMNAGCWGWRLKPRHRSLICIRLCWKLASNGRAKKASTMRALWMSRALPSLWHNHPRSAPCPSLSPAPPLPRPAPPRPPCSCTLLLHPFF